MRTLRTSLALLALTCLATFASAVVPLTTFTTVFYADVEGVQTQVGTGILSVAGSYPADGIYDYDPFTNFHMTLTFDGGHVFTEDNFWFSPEYSRLVITGTEFQFTGGPDGEMGGSIDFKNQDNDYISFSNADDPSGYTYLLVINYNGPNPEEHTALFAGPYGPLSIPEPASAALLMGTASLAALVFRRRSVA
ncbi:PEP-CTERM sorting domain-containing protein [Rariglobus hedericola]|uniref:PEP-CTERM sorting domain-containing protein n=1 Tax=Rariglobus hedericola TaxID=2597822 RepID=A0A556QPA3_9BACT|nr:PEP-CTERM sorting domain-containing protein [Rariglobus hedericola]TSJ78457.1 PEP-CTERM sorting domain-containing protein [Rariglobus hedericola]